MAASLMLLVLAAGAPAQAGPCDTATVTMCGLSPVTSARIAASHAD